jgi:hypothetical protein
MTAEDISELAIQAVLGYEAITWYRHASAVRRMRYPNGPAYAGRLVPMLIGGFLLGEYF